MRRCGAPRSWPVLDAGARRAVDRVLRRGVLSGAGAPEVRALERELSAALGGAHVVAAASGTASLMAAFTALGLAPGSTVLVPACTFGATALAVLLCGLRPRFVDVDPASFNLDAAGLEAAWTADARAVVAVHLHGLPCDLDAVLAFARRRGLAVVEDCAQAFGALYEGRPVGTWGDAGCFSLQSSKHLGAGEGGFLATRDAALARRARSYCSFGLEESGAEPERERGGVSVYREHLRPGGMFRLQELPAALARAQLRRLPRRLARVQAMAGRLLRPLSDLPGLLVPVCGPERTHAWHKIRIGLDAARLAPGRPARRVRDLLRQALAERGLATTLWQAPILPLQTAFAPYAGERDWRASRAHRAVEASFVLFDERHPLIAQPAGFAGAAARSFLAAWGVFLERLAAGGAGP